MREKNSKENATIQPDGQVLYNLTEEEKRLVTEDVLPIDFDLSLEALTQWHNNWRIRRFGRESLDPSRYYKTFISEDKCYLYGVKQDEKLLEEAAIQERVLELLCRIRQETRILKGIELNQRQTFEERQESKKRRAMYYDEYQILIKEPKHSQPDGNNIGLSDEVNTPRAQKYFAKAIEAGYMKKTEQGFEWLFGGSRGKVRLGYFLLKVYCPTNTEALPETELNILFGKTRIGSAITQCLNANKAQRWREPINNLFND